MTDASRRREPRREREREERRVGGVGKTGEARGWRWGRRKAWPGPVFHVTRFSLFLSLSFALSFHEASPLLFILDVQTSRGFLWKPLVSLKEREGREVKHYLDRNLGPPSGGFGLTPIFSSSNELNSMSRFRDFAYKLIFHAFRMLMIRRYIWNLFILYMLILCINTFYTT